MHSGVISTEFSKVSMVFYIGMGWCIILAIKPTLEALPLPAFLWLLSGGVAYTVGAVIYGLSGKRRYMHSLFHIFVVLGSLLQFICIFFYVI